MRNQKDEIATIKERTVVLNLSEADCQRIAEKAGSHGLTVGQLLENFIGDLVNGTYTNGSDERNRASDWFERCWFSYQPEETLLRHLIEWGCMEEFLDNYRYLQEALEDLNAAEGEEDREAIQEEVDYQQQELKEQYEEYCGYCIGKPEPFEQAVSGVLKWNEELMKMKGEA